MFGTTMSLGFIALQLSVGYLLYFAAKCIYRLTLHPLARFPGPKRAAMTRLFAMSWDIPQETSYVKEFTTWHDKYESPIVRIEPEHLHIRDIDAYNEIFKVGTKFTRDPTVYGFPATRGSIFNELDQKKAVLHRSLYNQYFSKVAVQSLQQIIQEHLAKFLRMIEVTSKLDRPVDLSLGFRCLMADTLMKHLYDQPLGSLDSPDFQNPMILATEELLKSGPAVSWYGGKAFVWIFRLLMKLPRHWIGNRGIAESLRLRDGCKARLIELSKGPRDKVTPTVFVTALDPKTQKGQPKLDFDDLAADGIVFFTAGTDTTANALSFAVYNLIRTQSLLQKLRSEISTVITEPTVLSSNPATTTFPVTWSTLEQLPYLHGVVKEAIRHSLGVPGKIPCVVPPGGATLSGQFIPAGTTVSSASYSYFSNPQFYINPDEFKPERWIQDEDGGWSANNGVDSEKYFVAFSRGSRNCIGMNLAYAQLNYTIAYLVRNFEMHLHEDMTERDMEWHDTFTTMTFGHLRVRMKRISA